MARSWLHAQYAEIIPDLIHVHPGAIRVAPARYLPPVPRDRFHCRHRHAPDGEYRLGQSHRLQAPGAVCAWPTARWRAPPHARPGPAHLVDELGLTVADAPRRVSTYAADFLRGRPRPPVTRGMGRPGGAGTATCTCNPSSSKRHSVGTPICSTRRAKRPRPLHANSAPQRHRLRLLYAACCEQDPTALLTAARGSSDHAAHFLGLPGHGRAWAAW